MKSIITVSSAFALAFAGMASAQDAPAPVPAAPVAPAAEVSKEAKDAAGKMIAMMKEMAAVLPTVKDKATADAAAEKIAKINEKGEALAKEAMKVQGEMDAAMKAHEAELMPLFMGMMTEMQRLQQAEFYGSEALQKAMRKNNSGDGEEVEEVEVEEVTPAPAPAAK